MNFIQLHYLVSQGWHVWREFHPYYADHSRGGWYEWLTIQHSRSLIDWYCVNAPEWLFHATNVCS